MRVGEKGQVTIPIEYRQALGLHAGSEVDAELPERDYRRLPLPYEAGFLAGRPSSATGGREGNAARPFRTSTSEHTPPCRA
jgi:AbrB family looped-hinge helix DNA binding protein